MLRALRAHLIEPAPARAARPNATDTALSVIVIALACCEALVRRDLPLPIVQLSVACIIALTLRWRRSHPAHALVAAFVVANVLTVCELAFGLRDLGLLASATILLHPYAVLRYGSGREALGGLAILACTFVASALTGRTHGAQETIGAMVVLFFPAAIGASMRFRALAQRRAIEHAQMSERQMLARELHDTVAHHVSAIIVQAQAAQAVARKRPEAATAALAAIESEASKSLAELRSLVGALRDDTDASRAPRDDARAIEALVAAEGPHATFEREGAIEQLSPAVSLALHRIARESLHNVRKHGRAVRAVRVRLAIDASTVRLTVRDDAESSTASARGGFGIIGMRERAALLGGTLAAGPLSTGGWQVEAVLPTSGARS